MFTRSLWKLVAAPLFLATLSFSFSLETTAAEEEEASSPIFDLEALPNKLGVAGNWVWQKQPYQIDQFEITSLTAFGFPVVGDSPFGPDTIQSIENQAHSFTTRVDYWALPFLNVYGILGHVDGAVDVALGTPIDQLFTFRYDGLVYGAGAVVAYGWKQVFFSTDVSYVVTDLSDGASIETWVASPKIGFNKGKFTAWVGGTYQATSHEQMGVFTYSFYDIGYNAVLSDANNWNYTAGARWDFNEHWNLIVETGFGDRRQVMVMVGYRF